jgi:hypothetical protein
MVVITDARGCQTTAMAKVTAPTDLKIEGTTHDPLCYKGNNGRIELKITGGRPPYSFKWSTGATTQTLSGAAAGNYSVIVTDSEKCASYMDFTLSDPEPISVSLGEDRTLCRGQKHELKPLVNDPKTRFAWTGPGGFTSSEPRIMADKEGIYTLTITDSNGCQATDEINISVMDVDITAEIVVASQVFTGDTVVMVNISNPMPESAQWFIGESDSLQIVAQSEHQASIIFRYPGFYTVGLRTFVGDCFADVVKHVSVMDSDLRDYGFSGESLIRKFLVRPTPNDGRFTVDVELGRVSSIRVRLINIGTGIVMADNRYYGQFVYSLPYNLLLAGGGYIVTLETEAGSMVAKMVVK